MAGPNAGLLYLSLQSTIDLLDPADVVRLAEETLLAHDSGDIIWSTPRIIAVAGESMKAKFRVKLCAVTSIPAVGFRVTSSVSGVAKLAGGPTRMVLLSDVDTGEFRVIVDERWTFAVRTGAGAAVAIKHIHSPDTEEVGLIGAGHMGRGTVYALKAALPKLKRIYLSSRTAETRDKLAAELTKEVGIKIVPVATSREVLDKALAVVVSTTAKAPIIEESWIRPGATIYTMGAEQELDTPSYTKVDKFIADDWGQVQLKADMIRLMKNKEFSEADLYGDMPRILAGKLPGRESADERIVVRSEGLVTMDVAVAAHLYKLALERGLGQKLDI